jgi:hypothetical protein
VNVEFTETDDASISGLREYGYGYWCKWFRTGPLVIWPKAPWYTLSRLTQNRNHGDAGPGDRGLAIWLG